MAFRKYIRRNIYKWHRATSLIVAIPVLLWTLSGFLHPIMSSMKPDVKNQSLKQTVIDTSKIRLSLPDALKQNGIASIHNFRIVKMYTAFYYQVQQPGVDSLSYISCYNAQWLPKGDEQYAAYLAQRYLSEESGQNQKENSHHGANADTRSLSILNRPNPVYEKVNIKDVQLVKSFDAEYKKSNLLLPVYQVSFYRSDNIRLYIETSTDRLATAIDNRKAWFTRFFSFTHSWSFLDGMGIGKNILLGTVSLLCFLTSLFGFYVYNITNKKKSNAATQKNKNRHRLLGNVFVATTMLYALSGAWHSFHKISGKEAIQEFADQSLFAVNELDLSTRLLLQKLDTSEKLTGVSVARMDHDDYWQLSVTKGKEKYKKYFEINSLSELGNGDQVYGCYLACKFSKRPEHSIKHSKCLTSFNHQYSMMNKRLPVIEVGFDNRENYYVETGTGKLAAVVDNFDKAERFSFSNFHMHHYWEMWLNKEAGKPVRNLVLISTTLGLLLLALTGMIIYFRKQKRKA